MDPLSITAGVIAVVGAAQESGKVSLKFLRNLKIAPRELQNLIDEVTQIGAVLDDVKSAVETGGKSSASLDLLLKKATATLLELEKLIHYELIQAKGDVRVDRVAWATHQKQVIRFQEQLRNIRHDITVVLSAGAFSHSSQASLHLSQVNQQLGQFNSRLSQVTQLQIDLQELVLVSTKPSQNAQDQYQLRIGHQALEGLCQSIEESPQTREALTSVLGDFRTPSPNTTPMGPMGKTSSTADAEQSSEPRPTTQSRSHRFHPLSHGSEFRMRASTGPGCPKSCRCACHKQKRFTSPAVTRRWTGMATITYSGISRFGQKCSLRTCKRHLTTSSVMVNYTLPTWIASAMITFWLNKAPIGGPELLLRTSRLVETNAYYYARNGMLEELRYMFLHGEASVHDFSPSCDQNAISVAIDYKNYEVLQFLMDYGGNIDQATPGGRSAKDFILLAWALTTPSPTPEVPEVLRFVDLDDVIDDQYFTSLHRIILGLTSRNLDEELQEHPEIVNVTDTMGRTPLWWATRIEDVTSTQTLLSLGADPMKGDLQNHAPLHNSVLTSSQRLLEMLLDYNVDVDVKTRNGETPLYCCYSNLDLDLARVLLDRGANPNACDALGRTLLHSCALEKSDLVTGLLLQRGADQNIADKEGCYPWQRAVIERAAQVLRVLSRHGCRFSDTMSDGSTVLHLAARDGDMATAQALKEIDLSHIDADATDEYGHTAVDELEYRYHGDRLRYGWHACSAESYAALKDLITHVRASNYRVHETSDDTDDSDSYEYESDDESSGDDIDDSSDEASENEDESLFEDAREEWEQSREP